MTASPELTEQVAAAMYERDWSPSLWTRDELWAKASKTEQRQIYLRRAEAAIAEIERHRSSPSSAWWIGMEPTTRDLCIAFEAGWPDTTLVDDKQLTGLRRAIKAYLAVVKPLPEPPK